MQATQSNRILDPAIEHVPGGHSSSGADTTLPQAPLFDWTDLRRGLPLRSGPGTDAFEDGSNETSIWVARIPELSAIPRGPESFIPVGVIFLHVRIVPSEMPSASQIAASEWPSFAKPKACRAAAGVNRTSRGLDGSWKGFRPAPISASIQDIP